MIEVGVNNPDLVIFIGKLEGAIEEHMGKLTLAELVGGLELVKTVFINANIYDESGLH